MKYVVIVSNSAWYFILRKTVLTQPLQAVKANLYTVVLQGRWIERDHCMIDNNCGIVTLRPVQGAHCTVNGCEVTRSCRLSQGKAYFFWESAIVLSLPLELRDKDLWNSCRSKKCISQSPTAA